MEFARRLSRSPLPHDREAAAEVAAAHADLPPELRDLLAGTAGCSPFLRGLIERDPEWLRALMAEGPEAALQAVLDELGAGARDAAAMGVALRQAKAKVALLTALADLGGVWPLAQVTGALTRFADAAVGHALAAHLAPELARGALPGHGPDAVADGAGMAVFAMGKMGAGELNYSSDIDLICLFDDARFDPADLHEARQVFVRVTRKMAACLNDHTEHGYVFRTDLRLRPDASVTPVCLSMDAAERYYESLGRTWERAAWIKARPCAGDLAAGARFQDILRPFVWRRHLDFAAIEDAHDMRLRIRAHKNLGGPLVLEGHNVKLGQGGIREIEFFTQTRQLIAGGRDPDLRARDTVGGLRALADKGWVEGSITDRLIGHYRVLREIEHRVQMVGDAQTHLLPTTDEGFDRLARFCGEGDTEALRADLRARFSAVHRLTEGFFAPSAPAQTRPELSDAQDQLVRGWPSLPALRSVRAREIFKRLEPVILARLAAAPAPDEAILGFDRFLAGLPAGVQLFALFEANPSLIDLLIDVLTSAPVLCDYLGRNAQVLDAVIGGDFFASWPGMTRLCGDLAALLSGTPDYERKLDAARRWQKEWHFRIGVHHLRGLIDTETAGREYAELADAVLCALWPEVVAEFTRKHGPPPGRGAVVLGMGSLGAGSLNAGSDLDLIVVFDEGGQEASDGPRPLAARPYYARLTQALVTAISAPMAEGRLYEVDMRLRPSGRQGPVATSRQAFVTYQREDAWTWEHLALTRARPVAGDPGLAAEIEDIRRALLAEKGPGARVRPDVAEMRARLRAAKKPGGPLDARNGAGRLQDIDLAAQMLALIGALPVRPSRRQLAEAAEAGLLPAADAATLVQAHRLMARVVGVLRLVAGSASAEDLALSDGGMAMLLRETDHDSPEALIATLAETANRAAALIDGLTQAGG